MSEKIRRQSDVGLRSNCTHPTTRKTDSIRSDARCFYHTHTHAHTRPKINKQFKAFYGIYLHTSTARRRKRAQQTREPNSKQNEDHRTPKNSLFTEPPPVTLRALRQLTTHNFGSRRLVFNSIICSGKILPLSACKKKKLPRLLLLHHDCGGCVCVCVCVFRSRKNSQRFRTWRSRYPTDDTITSSRTIATTRQVRRAFIFVGPLCECHRPNRVVFTRTEKQKQQQQQRSSCGVRARCA